HQGGGGWLTVVVLSLIFSQRWVGLGQVNYLFFAEKEHAAVRMKVDNGRRLIRPALRNEQVGGDTDFRGGRKENLLADVIALIGTFYDFRPGIHFRWTIAQEVENLGPRRLLECREVREAIREERIRVGGTARDAFHFGE